MPRFLRDEELSTVYIAGYKNSMMKLLIPLNISSHKMFSHDGVHLNQSGMIQLVRQYKTVLNPIIGVADYSSYSSSGTTNSTVSHGDSYDRNVYKHPSKTKHSTLTTCTGKI
jgi:hypothetical protein